MLSSSEFHKHFKAFKISIHEVGINGLAITRPMSPEALTALIKEPNNEQFSWQALEHATVMFKIWRENDKAFKINAQTNLHLTCACVRCLEPVAHQISIDFAIIMMEKAELCAQDCFFDSDADLDTSVGYFSDRAIDLGMVLREQIFLEVPDYPHCRAKTALLKSTCKPAVALISEKVTTRENPFVKFWKTK